MQKPNWRQRVVRWLILGGLALFLVSCVPVVMLRWLEPPVTAFMLLNNQMTLNETRYTWQDRAALGDQAALAVIAAEDQRFTVHHGLDRQAIFMAVEERKASGRIRGASTISQQLAKNLFLWPGQNLLRKGTEAWFAILIDAFLPKRRILELYLNVVELGPGLYGVPAASRLYFGVEPADLNARQAALLAAVLPNPNTLHVGSPSRYLQQRQEWIADQAARLGRDAVLERIDWAGR